MSTHQRKRLKEKLRKLPLTQTHGELSEDIKLLEGHPAEATVGASILFALS